MHHYPAAPKTKLTAPSSISFIHAMTPGRKIAVVAVLTYTKQQSSGTPQTAFLRRQNASAFMRASVSPPAITPWKCTECRGSTRAMKKRPTSSFAS